MQANPDLQEFLSALNGFLSKPVTASDPGYVRFLEIFFRTVKASKGHLLKRSETGVLQSVLSFGLTPDFDREFNSIHQRYPAHPCPLDWAYKREEAVAIVDFKREKDIPQWFMQFMAKEGFSSLVAVPLMGAVGPVGILCAYYEDICLFDEGTLNHLMMMGRMVGGASEKSIQAASAQEFGERERWLDEYLHALTTELMGSVEIYSQLTKMTQQGLQVNGVVAGPVNTTSGRMLMTPVAGKGATHDFSPKGIPLVPFLIERIKQTEWVRDPDEVDPAQLGEMARFIPENSVTVIIRPLLWGGQIRGAVLAWRLGGPAFEKNDFQLLSRMAAVTSLALRTV